jgi:hypothetical protein
MDGRLYITGMSTSLADKKNVTTSFNPVSLSWYGCEVNHAANMWKSEKEVKVLTAEAFCLTDQAYPPVFPVSSNLNCLKVIRREDGTLMELANELLAMVRGKEAHKQSIVLMHSLSHMAKAGTEGYIEDFLVAASKLKAALGVHIQVVPLSHLFMAGCTCPLAIRTAAEVMVWAAKTFGDDGNFLTNSFKLANYLLSPRMGDDCQTDYERLMRLPMAAKWPSNKAIWVISSFDLPLAIHPTTEGAEREIILSIIGELRTGLALELDQFPSLDRKMPARGCGGQPESIDYLIIGRTKTSAMMADALVRKGKKCELVSYPEWRITQAFVTRMVTDLTAAMAAKRPKAIIVAGLDESYYMAQFEEVHTSPARKDAAGHYHIDGDLMVAAKTAQLRMLNILAPVWEQTEGMKTEVVCPMVRYITEGCCDDGDHIPNRLEPGFHDRLKKDLLVARNVLKDFFQTEGHTHCRVLDPAVDIAGKDGRDVWDKGDPTHPKAATYDSMVVALGKAEARIDVTKRQGAALPGPAPKRPRLASAEKKPSSSRGSEGGNPGRDLRGRGGAVGSGGGRSRGGGGSGRGNGGGTGRGRGWRGNRPNRWDWQEERYQHEENYGGGGGWGWGNGGGGGGNSWRGRRFWAPAFTGGRARGGRGCNY